MEVQEFLEKYNHQEVGFVAAKYNSSSKHPHCAIITDVTSRGFVFKRGENFETLSEAHEYLKTEEKEGRIKFRFPYEVELAQLGYMSAAKQIIDTHNTNSVITSAYFDAKYADMVGKRIGITYKRPNGEYAAVAAHVSDYFGKLMFSYARSYSFKTMEEAKAHIQLLKTTNVVDMIFDKTPEGTELSSFHEGRNSFLAFAMANERSGPTWRERRDAKRSAASK